jgi:hypothetical protein
MRMTDVDVLVDRFVQGLNRKPFVSSLADQVPEELRTGETSLAGDPLWQITAFSNDWVSDVEERLPFQLPNLYRSLISRYRYDEFENGPILFLANIDEQSGRALFTENQMTPILLKEGFLQFARPQAVLTMQCVLPRGEDRRMTLRLSRSIMRTF